jgi:heavy metal translocating P-type ATPase
MIGFSLVHILENWKGLLWFINQNARLYLLLRENFVQKSAENCLCYTEDIMQKRYILFGLSILVLIAGIVAQFAFGAVLVMEIGVIAWAGILSIFIIAGMIRDIRRGSYGVDILALAAIWATIVAGQPIAGAVIMVMLTGGESLEDYANRRARRELTKLMDRRPNLIHVWRGKDLVDVPADEVRIGEIISIKTGEMVPVDGSLEAESANLDTSSITGEALPVNLASGEKVVSGSVNVGAAFEMKVATGTEESEYGQILKLVKELEERPAKFVRLADRYAVPFTIIAFGIAGAAWAISGDFMRFAQVLVVASPCPLILAAPVAFMAGMSRASKNGIIVKNGTVLERLARVKSLAFDKTGTLSRGEVTVSEAKSFSPDFSDKDILRIVAAGETGSSHILARSVVSYAREKKISLRPPEKIIDHTGRGIDGIIEGNNVVIGSLAHLKLHRVNLDELPDAIDLEKSAIFLAVDKKAVGIITFRDVMRRDARGVIGKLKQMNIAQIAMITGDAEAAAKTVAEKVGINKYFAESLPADKVRIVEKELEKPVAFVGDGVNDAPVLAAADVGIAMGAFGSTAATESADVVVMADSLGRVPVALSIARRTLKVGKQSVLIGIFISIGLMVVASFGWIPVIVGAILQEALDVTSILNALRARK